MSDRNLLSRRALFGTTAAAAVGLAGCSGDSSEEPSTETPEPTATDSEYMNGVGTDAAVSLAVPSAEAELTSPYVQWQAMADGVAIEEAGEVTDGAGHYHIMVDTAAVSPGETIPGDERHIHYGTGQSDGVLELEPGEHTLTLQVADGEHVAMGLTDTVAVSVADEASLDVETSVDGSVVEWDVTAENYTIEAAAEGVNSNAGHLHAIIDSDHVPVGEVIPSDATHAHFGDGSTSGSLDLAEQLGDAYKPGEHKIHFQVGSGTHRATMVHAHETITTE